MRYILLGILGFNNKFSKKVLKKCTGWIFVSYYYNIVKPLILERRYPE